MFKNCEQLSKYLNPSHLGPLQVSWTISQHFNYQHYSYGNQFS